MPQAIPYLMVAASAASAYEAHEARKDAKEQQKKLEQEQAELRAKAEAEKERKRREDALRFGITKTLVTSPFGDVSGASTQKKTLLGQ